MQTTESNLLSNLPAIKIVAPNTNLNSRQQDYLEKFIARYTQKTKTSKQQTQKYRPILADVRGSAGFRAEYKEIVYPIIGKYALGSKMWDIDDNQYVDLMMGFGVNLFGYNPPFIKEAITKRLEQGIHIGPQSDLVGEVARLVCELTGMERVTISNTGTEAVMTALRLARAATGRNKIVMFSGSYHGHFDGTLAKSQIVDGVATVVPTDIGVPQNVIADVLVLEYGSPQALEVIKAHASELAAVIIEPVQNSRPDLQPREFLISLRQLTVESGIALIFDEMLTGFRIHPNGAQGWFGIKADIATYGKIVGGGMPIGIIAGKAMYMDKIDGGMWNYGDASSPQVETTFFAGTYCKHPLAMTAGLAVLEYIQKEGLPLYENLNNRTTEFINKLNHYFQEDKVPIRLANCGSIFNAVPSGNSISSDNPSMAANLDLVYYHLIEKGIFLRPGGGLLSTAHSNEDLDFIIQALKESIQDLREGGFLP
jgi:glutamate-1-semialdehyde 2,1-aminomutase